MDRETVLAIVAHPDDETFWMGATLASLASQGYRVKVYALSSGVGSREDSHDEDTIERVRSFHNAIDALGLEGGAIRQTFVDQRSDQIAQLAINKAVEELIALNIKLNERPGVVFTHWVGDLNIDHRRVAEAVLVATRGICRVLMARPEWPRRSLIPFDGEYMETKTPDADSRRKKALACACYRSELRPDPHPRSAERLARPIEVFVVCPKDE